MKILYHHRTAADDGQAVHIRELQAAFRRQGHDVREVALVRRSDAAGAHRSSLLGAVADRVPAFVREGMEHAYDFAGRKALRDAIGRERPDFLYERYALSTACGAQVSRQARLPFVLEVNSPLVDEVSRTRGLAFPGWARRKEASTLRAATVLCVVSGALREWAAGLGVERDRILLTPNGVDRARFCPGEKDARLVRELDIGGRVVVGFTGFVREWHRLDVALDAFAARGLDRQGGVFLVVGDGPALEGLRAHAARLGIEKSVRFTGMIPHARVADYVRLLDVALVTAINPYASPLKLFEYLAVGAACVVADQPNLREILTPEAARFVPAGDPARLGEVLTELVRDARARAALGRAGLALLTERDYTWDGNARRVVNAVLERAAAGARA